LITDKWLYYIILHNNLRYIIDIISVME